MLAGNFTVCAAGRLFYHLPAKTGFPFAELFSRLLYPPPTGNVIPPVLNLFLASMIVFMQAMLLNYLVNHYNLLGKSTFLPALMYITVSGLFTPFLILSPPLICNFLVIWMLFKMFELL